MTKIGVHLPKLLQKQIRGSIFWNTLYALQVPAIEPIASQLHVKQRYYLFLDKKYHRQMQRASYTQQIGIGFYTIQYFLSLSIRLPIRRTATMFRIVTGDFRICMLYCRYCIDCSKYIYHDTHTCSAYIRNHIIVFKDCLIIAQHLTFVNAETDEMAEAILIPDHLTHRPTDEQV